MLDGMQETRNQEEVPLPIQRVWANRWVWEGHKGLALAKGLVEGAHARLRLSPSRGLPKEAVGHQALLRDLSRPGGLTEQWAKYALAALWSEGVLEWGRTVNQRPVMGYWVMRSRP